MMRVLLTGMSCTGKSAVIRELAVRGHTVVDLDDAAWSAWVDADGDPTGALPGKDWFWREDRVHELLAADGAGMLFASGCAPNMGAFLGRFDHVVLLRAPALVMLVRLASRTDNPYGKRPEEVAAVLGNLREVEPRLRAVAGHEVDLEASRTTCRRLGQAWRSSRPRSSSAGSASTGPQACIPPLIRH